MDINFKTVLSYNNFDNLAEDIVALAKEIMPDKSIHINFLNDEVQVTMKVSKHDTKVNITEGNTIPVNEAICNNIDFENAKPLILEDTRNNSFNELVNNTIKNDNIGSYLGIPIIFKNGKRFGALCATHHDKGVFNEEDIKLLEKISNLFSYYLELENHAYVDQLTDLKNSRFLLINQDEILKNGVLLLMIDLDNFKAVNDTLGHHIGDLVLKEIGGKLSKFTFKFKSSYAIRLGGDEFLIYIKDNLEDLGIKSHLENLNKELRNWQTDIGSIKVTASIGAYKFKANCTNSYTNLYNKVDLLLYEAKKNKKDTFVFESYLNN